MRKVINIKFRGTESKAEGRDYGYEADYNFQRLVS